ncbi:MAG: cupin domain-containing protein [Chloroflexi bacterium]|nr:MAG: cupin domain-containing protein [Chloroflexota bacterium]TMB82373.1 MAG: cupin domain-containing protein [Chloroflexota bacterium]
MPHTHTRGAPYAHERGRDHICPRGTLSAEIDGEELNVEVGEYLFKPRGLKHEFWNPTSAPTRIIEIVAPRRSRAALPDGRHIPGLQRTEDFDRLVLQPDWGCTTRPASDLEA